MVNGPRAPLTDVVEIPQPVLVRLTKLEKVVEPKSRAQTDGGSAAVHIRTPGVNQCRDALFFYA
ncbi:hypothetical protein WQE_32781 [Paraburkholderia hospita]|uniref:Uncharacterized protein n=1 Tax=Paraburkholderia hospita TaxID=169430 RepID=A0ABN0FDG9_9BURK|nr:hypothetical protein WQE_32781 [Paraburkholderia hospita]OUL87799.1 hypothetical protein CA602_12650 [Paraburkholderia hospita]